MLRSVLCVCQASAERNYHIFYQLCASRELPEMRSFKLGETLVLSIPMSTQIVLSLCP